MEQKTSAQLRAEADAATSTATALAERRGTVDRDIERVGEAIRAARLAAARAGTAVEEAGAAERLELEGLLEERDTLPERHHAARENAAMLGISAEAAVVREISPQVAQARSDLRPLEAAAAQAVAAVNAQAAHLAELEGVVSTARTRGRRHEQLLQSIEAEGITSLYG